MQVYSQRELIHAGVFLSGNEQKQMGEKQFSYINHNILWEVQCTTQNCSFF